LYDLREGTYDLEVRLIDDTGPLAAPTSFHFVIDPPWYRTWVAYAAEVLVLALAILLTVRVSLQRARRRNAELEQTVAERTEELKATMEKLQQETRTAATLAERNRLAGEIHDSLEQGFSGLLLHLETTSGLADCPPRVQGALTVARNMVAFSRNEVRHAVWDLHSPLLDSGGLETALKNIVTQVGPDATRASVTVVGESRRLGSTLEHHLLRIAQEAIANAVKHSSAAHLDITLNLGEAELDLTVQDDGRGFDPQAVLAAPAGHFGLRSLRGRAAKIGGVLEIVSEPGRGTRVSVRVPLRVNPAI
jgi:signal transduction histidine kinase